MIEGTSSALSMQMAWEQLEEVPSATKKSIIDGLCLKAVFARSMLCPEQCPFAAEVEGRFCHFRCVQANECGLVGTHPNKTIPDRHLWACRTCDVDACQECVASRPGESGVALDRCKVCMRGYTLTKDYQCSMGYQWVIKLAVALLLGVSFFALGWYISIWVKPIVNQAGVDFGDYCRTKAMVQHIGPVDHRQDPYPLYSTNLLKTNVAGPGTMCLFRFQFAIICWAVVLLVVWLGFAAFVSPDLLTIGKADVQSPQMFCAVIAWGHQRQKDLLWTKVAWLIFAYVFSFIGALIYAVRQTVLFARIDAGEVSMSDFLAILEGLPRMKGHEKVEDIVKEKVIEATGAGVADVSVAWDFHFCAREVERTVAGEVGLVEDAARAAAHASVAAHSGPLGWYSRLNGLLTRWLLGIWHIHLDSGDPCTPREQSPDLKQLLLEMETCSTAFVVFSHEDDRDRAVQAVKDKGIEICGTRCTLKSSTVEPEEIMWQHFHVTAAQRKFKLLRAFMLVLGACVLWTVMMYLPYAMYMVSFTYQQGDAPGYVAEYLFIGLVVGSQLGLFVTSSVGANMACYRYEEEKQKKYIQFYNGALLLNLFMDIILQSYLSYKMMIGQRAHTAAGQLLKDLDTYQEILESYPMQKTLGKYLVKYCWPSTFLYPFLSQPVLVQWLAYNVGKLLVRSNTSLRGVMAAKAMELGEMCQGRYADVLFNTTLVALVPFVAPANMHVVLFYFLVSHIYIYLYDHWKVLRCVVRFQFTSPEVHKLAMQLFALPVSCLAGALVFKANQLRRQPWYENTPLSESTLLPVIIGVMLLHLLVHYLMVEMICWFFWTPCVRKDSNASYAKTESQFRATYFSTNPIHCMRSKYVLGHDPPQPVYACGLWAAPRAFKDLRETSAATPRSTGGMPNGVA